ncbi:MAG: DNA-3-methyladenine glycosylase I [Promethearchaeota archaeon]|nr:MAG: DNA-3-methyladenine glycosylase I [Candidatus Lokiarchaeota archaeon]
MVYRCEWSNYNKLMREYHDKEWGVQTHDDRTLFEFLILEGAQAGLSWNTILQKRENYRNAFDNFDCEKISQYNESKIEELINNDGIIRNRLKMNAAVLNAKALLKVKKEFGSFDHYIWQFVNYKPIIHKFKTFSELPSSTRESEMMSKDLKKRGFKFIGPTICYAFMQAVGMVNDHVVDCFRYDEINGLIEKQ